MRVLVTGGYGFIGSHVCERFDKEGHEVFVLDNGTSGSKPDFKMKHKHFDLDIADRKVEEIFRSNQFDLVVHLAAETDESLSNEQPVADTHTNILGLVNILNFAAKFKVKKLIYASSIAVYGSQEAVLDEKLQCHPDTIYGMNKRLGEVYCEKWMQLYGLRTLSLRLANVYGPRQPDYSDHYWDNRNPQELIYVSDVVDAIYRAAISDVTGIYNLSASAEGDNQGVRRFVNNARIKRDLDWFPLYTLGEGIALTRDWFAQQELAATAERRRGPIALKLPGWFKNVLPFLENVAAFLLIIYLTASLPFQTNGASFDYKLVYIILFGILYGSKQSIISVVLSWGLMIYIELQNGKEIISLLYDPGILFQFALYLFFGLAVGYATDRKQQTIQYKDNLIHAQQDKLDFLTGVYHDTLAVKQDLQEQILNNGDSLGKIYSVIKELESLEPEKVIQSTVTVLEKIMQTSAISIYSVKPQALTYIRMLTKSSKLELDQQKSLKLSDYPELLATIESKRLYVNRTLDPKLPMLAAPIISNGEAVALVCIHHVEFERMTLYYENLFHICVELISGSVSRAFQYVTATADQRYLEGTMILKAEVFQEILGAKQEAKNKLGIAYVLLAVPIAAGSLSALSERIGNVLRDSDYMGISKAGDKLFILLSNTNQQEAQFVINRLAQADVDAVNLAGAAHD